MITRSIRVIQIAVSTDHIYGLTAEGEIYYRDKVSYTYNTGYVVNHYQKKEDSEEKKVWKKLSMYAKVDIPSGGEARDVQEINEQEEDVIVEEPARKIYKDAQTIKRVQDALKSRGFYKETNKSDGYLGEFTLRAIRDFQKSINLSETGEIDFHLCCALGLDQKQVNEIVTETDIDFNQTPFV